MRDQFLCHAAFAFADLQGNCKLYRNLYLYYQAVGDNVTALSCGLFSTSLL